MKKLSYLLSICFLMGLLACNNTPERPEPILDPNYEPTPIGGTPASTTTPATPNTPEPAQNAQGVWHYTCPNGCSGGGGSATPCATCGTTLVHNTAYHNNNGTPATPTTPITPTSTTGSSPITATPQPPQTPEPAQNANGVWHYTCPSGCAGGAGSAVACASCGTTLTHNSAYHQ